MGKKKDTKIHKNSQKWLKKQNIKLEQKYLKRFAPFNPVSESFVWNLEGKSHITFIDNVQKTTWLLSKDN